MEEPSQLEHSRQLMALVRARKLMAEAEALLRVLPQGHESTLDADKIDGLHAAEIIAKAVAEVVSKVSAKLRVGGGGGITGIGVDARIATHTADADAHINHLLYLLLDGTRAMTGNFKFHSNHMLEHYTATAVRLLDSATGSVYHDFYANKLKATSGHYSAIHTGSGGGACTLGSYINNQPVKIISFNAVTNIECKNGMTLMANLPGADPGNGLSELWMDAAAARVVKIGT